KRNLISLMLDRVRADVLRNAAGFTCCHTCLADRVHQGGLAMIDVSHERDHWRTWLEFFRLLDHRWWRDHWLLNLMPTCPFLPTLFFENKAVVLRDLRRHIRLNRLVLVRKNLEPVHQFFNELEIFQAKLRREFPYDNRWLDMENFLLLS